MTHPRRVIARVLEASDDHPDVEELYNRANKVDTGISIATVYRTVRLFEEAGVVEKHDFGDRPAREPRADARPPREDFKQTGRDEARAARYQQRDNERAKLASDPVYASLGTPETTRPSSPPPKHPSGMNRKERRDAARAADLMRAARTELGFEELRVDEDVAKVSVVGIGMRSQSGVAAKMFKVLSDEGVNIKVITTSEIKISVLIDRKYMELAVQALHDAFDLDKAA